jgi:hypothetical protein
MLIIRYLQGAGMLFCILLPGLLKAQPSGIQSRWYDESTHPSNIADYHQKKNIFYQISNNEEYLILNMIVPFAPEQKKILLFGMAVYVDLAGGSKKDLAILFPYRRIGTKYRPENLTAGDSAMIRQIRAGGDPSQMRNRRGGMLMNFDVLKHNLAAGAGTIVLKGYSDTAEVVAIRSSDPGEVNALMAYDSNGVLYYTLTLPFAKVPIKEKLKKAAFNLGLETGYFNPEASVAARRSGPGGPGGMGGRPGGVMGRGGGRAGAGMNAGGPGGRSGRPPMDPAQRQARMEELQVLGTPTKFWIKKIRLAEQD